MLRTIFVLFVITFACLTSDPPKKEKKIHNILKSVGKRGREEWENAYGANWQEEFARIYLEIKEDQIYYKLREKPIYWLENNPFLKEMPIDPSRYNDEPGYFFDMKWAIVEATADNLRWSLVRRHPEWKIHEWRFWQNQDDDMVAEVCGSPQKMNKYQFGRYRYRLNLNWKDFDEPNWYSEYHNTPNQQLKMTVVLNFTSTYYGYNTTSIWNIEWELKQDQSWFVGLFRKTYHYKIVRVVVGGGCTEFGTVDHNHTEQGHRSAISDLYPENNPDVTTFLGFFTPDPLKTADAAKDRIPFYWLYKLDPKNPLISVCSYRNEHWVHHSPDMLRDWFHKFNRMWHPKEGDKDFSKLQIIDVKPDNITARVTMRLQIGVFPNATVREWDFKFQAGYNRHGDEEWYIHRVEVLCSPHFDYQDESLKAIREVVTKDLMTTYVEHEKPVYFYSTIEFVQKFTENGVIEAEICDTGKVTNLTQLKFPMKHGYKFSLIPYVNENYFINTTLSNFTIDYDHIHLPARDEDYFTVYTLQTPYPPDPRSKTWGYEQEWKFYVKWHNTQQYYYIDRMEVACRGDLYISGKKYEPVDVFLRL